MSEEYESITAEPQWRAAVRKIGTGHAVLGGEDDAPLNVSAKDLADRTEWLRGRPHVYEILDDVEHWTPPEGTGPYRWIRITAYNAGAPSGVRTAPGGGAGGGGAGHIDEYEGAVDGEIHLFNVVVGKANGARLTRCSFGDARIGNPVDATAGANNSGNNGGAGGDGSSGGGGGGGNSPGTGGKSGLCGGDGEPGQSVGGTGGPGGAGVARYGGRARTAVNWSNPSGESRRSGAGGSPTYRSAAGFFFGGGGSVPDHITGEAVLGQDGILVVTLW